MNNRIKITFWFLFAMFALLIIYIGYFTVVEAPEVINNPYNLRLSASESSVKRGNIEDINGVVLAESIQEDDGFTRTYNYPRMYCHVIGYTGVGKTGVEAAYNAELLTLHNETLQKFLYIVTNKVFKKGEFSLTGMELYGNDVYAADTFDFEPPAAGGDEGTPEDLPEASPDEVPRHIETPTDVPAETPEEAPEDIFDEAQNDTPQETPEDMTEDLQEETTEAASEEETDIYENSDIDSEIKDIYDNIEGNQDIDLDSIASDGYESENNFFAPLKDGYVLKGNTVVLSIDNRIQEKAFELLGERRGSIVVSDVNTGKIKAMVSYPNYNPETVADNWDSLTTDDENTPLLNRATQGLYPPGSVFKIGMAQLIIDTGNEGMSFDCTGVNTFGNKTLRCYNETVHGSEGLTEAFRNSCNGYFAQAGLTLTKDRLITEALNLGYNKDYDFPLEHSESIFNLNKDSEDSELVDTSIGQGKTMATPLHINMITAAVANGGTMYTPQIAQGLKSAGGRMIKKYKPEEMGVVMSEETSAKIRELMREVVTNGTATGANNDIIAIAGKTGTAENGTDDDHIWFTGFAPYDEPHYAVTVMLEYGGKSSRTVGIANELFEYIAGLDE